MGRGRPALWLMKHTEMQREPGTFSRRREGSRQDETTPCGAGEFVCKPAIATRRMKWRSWAGCACEGRPVRVAGWRCSTNQG
jgi:hypothetical protein